MNIWAQIDALLWKFKQELKETKAKARELNGRHVRVDDYGRWRCSFVPTRGNRDVVRLTAHSSRELLKRLKEAHKAQPPPARPPKKTKKKAA